MAHGIIALLLLVGALFGAAPAARAADVAPTLTQDEVIRRTIEGQERIFARDYPAAEAIFDALIREAPDSPAGPFGRMAMLEVRMLEREDFHLEQPFLEASREGQRRAAEVSQRYAPSSWDLFLSASILGLDGFFKARKGQWWDAYTQGGKSRQIFRRIKAMDPAFVDADFGIGMYLYWRSVFTRDLWFLHMFPDKRNEGIAIVERVAREGRYVVNMAKANLVIMYFEERRFDDARRLLDGFLARYPKNVVLKRLMGKTMISQRQFDAAVGQFKGMLAIDPEITQPHYFIGAALVIKGDPAGFAEAERELRQFLKIQGGKYWPAHTHYWLGRLYEARGEKQAAESEYNAALALDPKIRDAVARVRGLGGGV